MDALGSNSQYFANEFANKFAEWTVIGSRTSLTRTAQAALDNAFESVENLKQFAENELSLTRDEFDTQNMNKPHLQQLKDIVITELNRIKDEKVNLASSPGSLVSRIGNIFMTFFLSMSARFHSETMFHKNTDATERFRKIFSQSTAANTDVPGLHTDGEFEVIETANSDASPDAIEAANDTEFEVISPKEEGLQSGVITLNKNIVEALEVIDTPRDGSCMLWSLEVALRKTNLGERDDERGIVRDIEIPWYRKIISDGLRKKAEELNDSELASRANDVECSGGNPVTWFGAIRIKPDDMHFIAPEIQKDRAIITKRDGQTAFYLCTKEGECICDQNSEGHTDFKSKFEQALKSGPAIFAENGHAMALKYNPASGEAQIGEQA
jgi:hypothetical protein